jgi:hypothetical protein
MPRLRSKTEKYAPSVRQAVRDAYSALLVARSLTNRHYKKPHIIRQRFEKIIADYAEVQSLLLRDFDSEEPRS